MWLPHLPGEAKAEQVGEIDKRSEMLKKLFAANKGISKLTGADPESIDEMMRNPDLYSMTSGDVDTNPRGKSTRVKLFHTLFLMFFSLWLAVSFEVVEVGDGEWETNGDWSQGVLEDAEADMEAAFREAIEQQANGDQSYDDGPGSIIDVEQIN